MHINSDLNPLTKFTIKGRSTEFKNILPWNISLMIMKTIPINTRIVISHMMKQGVLFWVYWKINGNWDNNMIRITQWRRNKSKKAGLWESQSGIQLEKLIIRVTLFGI